MLKHSFFPAAPNHQGTKQAFQNKMNAEPYGEFCRKKSLMLLFCTTDGSDGQHIFTA